MNWLSTVISALLGWLTGRQKSKSETLEIVNRIFRKGTEAKKNETIDTRFRRD